MIETIMDYVRKVRTYPEVIKEYDEEIARLNAYIEHYKLMWKAQKAENEKLAAQIVWEFNEERLPLFYQGPKGEHELTEAVTAERCRWFVKRIDELEQLIRRVEKRWSYAIPLVEQELRAEMQATVKEE